MSSLGGACLLLGLGLAVYGIAASLYGARTRDRRWQDSGRHAIYALAAVLTVAMAVLEAAFLRSDFSFEVVASHSSTTTPAFYKATALWSSQEGSLLLWVWLLSLWSSAALALTRARLRELQPYATAVLLTFAAFFCAVTIFSANPFATFAAGAVPAEGAGLNPLLRHPSMMIHPPMLYSGYTLFAVPFAFAIAALITRRVGAEWIAGTRRFALAAWLCLGLGILLGARWSYSELGWGGYWAWDPVENASLLPWLTGTAFLHSVMIQERRGMLKVWNVSLVLATGTLAVLGTFLVRSGILDSIHAFGASTLGVPFLVLIGVMTLGSIALVVARRADLRSEHRLDSLISREAAFLAQNLLLVGLAFVVWWGTFFPLISEALTGTKASVGPPWFDRYTVPLALGLVALAGLGPVLAWRRQSRAMAARNFAAPVAGGVIAFLVALALAGGESVPALLLFAAAGLVAGTVAQEYARGIRARRAMAAETVPVALVSIVRRNRRRYGGYLVHLGFAVMLAGVAASSAFQDARDVRLSPGRSVEVGGYTLKYEKPTVALGGEKISLGAVLDVSRGGRHVTTLATERGYYPAASAAAFGPVGRFFEGEATSEVGLAAGMRRDVWAAIAPDLEALRPLIDEADTKFADAGPEAVGLLVGAIAQRWENRPPPANFRVIVSPLVSWIWIGGLIVLGGGIVAGWPAGAGARRRVSAGYAARLARELGRA